MGSALAAVAALAAAFAQSGSATAHPQTLRTIDRPVAAFAQDGPIVGWFESGGNGCNTVHLVQLANGLDYPLPARSARNVTCRFVRSRRLPVNLALAGKTARALWTLPQESPLPLDYLLGAGAQSAFQAERRFLEIAHTARGVGQWFGGIAGDRTTLVYAVTSVDFADEGGCLAGTGPCTLVESGGGVYRIDGRSAVRVPGTGAAVEVAASGGAVAYVATGGIAGNGHPLPSATAPIEVVDATSGQEISAIVPQGAPAAIALTPHVLATLERTPLGLRVAWYDRETRRIRGSVPVPEATAPLLTASDRTIVFRVGRSIRAVSVASHRVHTLTRASSLPIGLSLEGNRLAWAENLGRRARIRALYIVGNG